MNHTYNYSASADNDNGAHADEEGDDLKTGVLEEEGEEIGVELNPDLELEEEEEEE